MATRKITTVYDVRRAKYDAELRTTRKVNVTGFVVLDAEGQVVGRCATRAAADRFVADSLNTQGWTIQSARV